MEYRLFIDESGDHGLNNLDPTFPVFVLCGVLFSEPSYLLARTQMNNIKRKFWGTENVVFHSSDIRRCKKEFSILFDLGIKSEFYSMMDDLMSSSNYTLFASCVRKEEFIKRFGKNQKDIYGICLSFLIERVVFYLDTVRDPNKNVTIVMEERGKKEDLLLRENYNRVRTGGTVFVKSERICNVGMNITFSNKKENLNGLQFADLAAYPIARHVLDKDRANPAFDLIRRKIYTDRGRLYGLKVSP